MDYLALLKSALIYLSAFFLSISLFWVVEKSDNNIKTLRYRIARSSLLLIAVVIPCLVAGLRANTVGVDVNIYIVPHMRYAYSCDTYGAVCKAINAGSEYLYAFLVYFASRFTRDASLLLFLVQFFTIAPIVKAVLMLRDRLSISLAMAVYLFVYFNTSLNMMRQSIACAFIILGTTYLICNSGKLSKNAILSYVTAVLFHKSGFIGVLIMYGLCKLLYSQLRTPFKYLIIGAIIALPLFLIPVYELLVGWGVLTGNFIVYGQIFLYGTIEKNWFISPFSLYAIAFELLSISLVALPFLFSLKMKKTIEYRFFETTTLASLLFFLVILFSMNTTYGIRISCFMDMFVILLLPLSVGKRERSIKKWTTYLYLICYWAVFILYMGWSGSQYYEFRF